MRRVKPITRVLRMPQAERVEVLKILEAQVQLLRRSLGPCGAASSAHASRMLSDGCSTPINEELVMREAAEICKDLKPWEVRDYAAALAQLATVLRWMADATEEKPR